MAGYLRIKICGITDPADGRQAALLGADAVGLNFYAPSLRAVDRARAETILRELPPFVTPVGIFVNQTLGEVIEQTLAPLRGALLTVQTYGESQEAVDIFPYRRIPAFPVRDRNSLEAIRRYLDLCRGRQALPAAVLVDAHVPGQYGGTGQTFAWDLLAEFRPGVPLLLAGGLTPENVAEAVRIVRPDGVDVASGVETAPRRKDLEKIRRFIGNAREAAARFG
jgi:phosphoribosylanthranilate isomerase